jgi:hypothetical protein
MSNLPPPPPQPGPQGYPQGFQQQGYGYSYGGTPYQYAGFWARFAAVFIDGMIIGVPLNIITMAAGDAAILIQLMGFEFRLRKFQDGGHHLLATCTDRNYKCSANFQLAK